MKTIDNNEITTISSIASIINNTLLHYGIEPAPIFKNVGINYNLIHIPDVRISVKKMQKLWKLCVDESNDPCFGLRAGDFFQPTALHALGFAWLASNTAEDALYRMIKYSNAINSSVSFTLNEHRGDMELVLSGMEKTAYFTHAATDFALVVILL